jgi:asparagine synthase (glutamine-hydrolysing)
VERGGGTPSGLWRTNDLRVAALQASEFGNFRQGTLAGLGLDVRDPTSDRRLFELCLSIPADQYLAGGQARALARRVLADRLPQVVLAETRKGFQGTDWHLGLVAAWDDIADEVDRIDASPAARRLIDVDRLRRLLDGPRQRDWNSAAAQADYRFALLRGVSAGHFIRSSESPS